MWKYRKSRTSQSIMRFLDWITKCRMPCQEIIWHRIVHDLRERFQRIRFWKGTSEFRWNNMCSIHTQIYTQVDCPTHRMRCQTWTKFIVDLYAKCIWDQRINSGPERVIVTDIQDRGELFHIFFRQKVL